MVLNQNTLTRTQLTGLLIALGTIYAIYILPRRSIPWRDLVGLPGV